MVIGRLIGLNKENILEILPFFRHILSGLNFSVLVVAEFLNDIAFLQIYLFYIDNSLKNWNLNVIFLDQIGQFYS